MGSVPLWARGWVSKAEVHFLYCSYQLWFRKSDMPKQQRSFIDPVLCGQKQNAIFLLLIADGANRLHWCFMLLEIQFSITLIAWEVSPHKRLGMRRSSSGISSPHYLYIHHRFQSPGGRVHSNTMVRPCCMSPCSPDRVYNWLCWLRTWTGPWDTLGNKMSK